MRTGCSPSVTFEIDGTFEHTDLKDDDLCPVAQGVFEFVDGPEDAAEYRRPR